MDTNFHSDFRPVVLELVSGNNKTGGLAITADSDDGHVTVQVPFDDTDSLAPYAKLCIEEPEQVDSTGETIGKLVLY